MSSSFSNAGMEMPTPLVKGIVNNTVLLQPTHQSNAASNYSHPVRFLIDSLLKYASDFTSQLDEG